MNVYIYGKLTNANQSIVTKKGHLAALGVGVVIKRMERDYKWHFEYMQLIMSTIVQWGCIKTATINKGTTTTKQWKE